MQYTVGTFRNVGLDARWTKTRQGAPIIQVRCPSSSLRHQRENWYMVDADMWARMLRFGILEGFEQCTLLADVFSIPGR